ncbi:Homeobox protein Nkx-6.1 [Papilio machaon]|uniref:Homeobox protein Nkx-6.1 n=1 Tax=Papilio machaon TaxID=76193 RepID=A0A194RAI2_PAPMA|nr:Homeobox protein Nkx-6.1 [Papilio machaon]
MERKSHGSVPRTAPSIVKHQQAISQIPSGYIPLYPQQHSQQYSSPGNLIWKPLCPAGMSNLMSTGDFAFLPNPHTTNPIRDYSSCCLAHQTSGRKCRESVIYRRSENFITKRKRRPIFTTQQILALEKIFNKKPYVNKQERQILRERINLNERDIKLWFKNRRRITGFKKEPTVISDSSGEETENKLNLDYVQSRINEPDEFGYVTLDERAMKELITVIDSLLTDVELDDTCMELKNNTNFNILSYEPVSPVSINDNADENICFPKWELYEPEESLRRLFDVQAFITK